MLAFYCCFVVVDVVVFVCFLVNETKYCKETVHKMYNLEMFITFYPICFPSGPEFFLNKNSYII